MRLLRAGDRRPMAWKNGSGETVEVAVNPPGAGLADFDWRISMATVAADGPFSTFPEIDRTLVVVDGAGLDLHVRGHAPQHLTPASAPHAFPGDVETTARLVAGPITDLNVMTRRGIARHRVGRMLHGDLPCKTSGRWVVLLALSGSSVVVRGRTVVLGALDALILDGGTKVAPCDCGGPAEICAVEIDAGS